MSEDEFIVGISSPQQLAAGRLAEEEKECVNCGDAAIQVFGEPDQRMM